MTNERDYRLNGTTGGAEVLGRRAARGILESSLNYGASRIKSNIGSWVGAVSRIPMRKVKSVYCAKPKRGPDNNSQRASCVSEAAMCNNNCSRICYPSEFFPDVKGNLTKIVWAHAVNSQAKLEKALSSGRSIGTAIDKARPGLLSFVYCTRETDDVALIILACSNTAGIAENVEYYEIFNVALVDVPWIVFRNKLG